MPSAQHVERDAPSATPANGDLHSLLREMRASNISNLNSLHGRGKILFAEGEQARGVYILRTGRATVSISSSEGRLVILRMAQPGDVLGLNSVLRNSSYEATVKTLEPSRTDFISRSELIELMKKSEAGTHAMLKILSDELTALTDRTRLLLLPQKASARLARLLLEWCKENGLDNSRAVRIDKVFTQEEIAQMICTSRETVTRLLATLSRRQIIRITSDSILICDCAALEKLALA
jgi:CRP/FNR family transcriptional regulator, cyclic AMP receptor protein